MSLFTRKPADTRKPAESFDVPTTAVDDISGTYAIDPTHTRLGFAVRHAMVTTVRGQFTAFNGTATIDSTTPANSKVFLTIESGSIDTGVADRDAHLSSADFFDTDNNKEISFSSTNVELDGNDWLITGDLAIKGITKSVSMVFEATGSARDPYGNLRMGFEGGTTVNRSDWGLSFNAPLATGGVLISEKVKLEFDISAIRNA